VDVKREARLKSIQYSTRTSENDYNRKRIAASRECCRKKRELLKTKVDEIVDYCITPRIKVRNIIKEFKH
jgi:hypothetical protein